MDWELTHTPEGPCSTCGNTPVDETDANKPPLPMIHALQFDINWGEELNLCMSCVGNIADLVGRPSVESVDKVKDQYKFQKKRADKAERKMSEQQVLIDKVRAGSVAQKALKEAK